MHHHGGHHGRGHTGSGQPRGAVAGRGHGLGGRAVPGLQRGCRGGLCRHVSGPDLGRGIKASGGTVFPAAGPALYTVPLSAGAGPDCWNGRKTRGTVTVADNITIQAEPRAAKGRGLNKLRASGKTPIVLYGKTREATALQVDARALDSVVQASGLSQLIDMQIEGQSTLVLLREVQRHPVRHHILHVDAYALQMDEKQTLQIPIVVEGEPDSAISSDLIIMQNMDTITIETFPDRIPQSVPVDLSLLTMDNNITVSDLTPIEDVAFVHEPDEVIFSLTRSAAVEEVEEAPEEAVVDEDDVEADEEPSAEDE
ncbi:MAG: 50S ribosomal protein L25 [Caldilineaceae bacterium SB0666_bin_21]|nr:50S ribosomal protein L25 [Caldilineaceae bacterium SB0666_bin_21]